MADAIIVVNSGSSSIKFSLFSIGGRELRLELHGHFDALRTRPRFAAERRDGTRSRKCWPEGTDLGHHRALDHLFSFLRAEVSHHHLVAVGHRVVHGGPLFTAPVRVDERVVEALAALTPLAPLHQPAALLPIRRLLERTPALPQVACFDTSFHRTNPEVAQHYALPLELHEAGVRRYGFHGLSFESIAAALPGVDTRAASGKTVVLHLGNGASMCALDAGRSVASTMGFTALDGLAMGTRSGSLDPGVILYLLERRGMAACAVEELLYQRSGLLGLSGISGDMRTLLSSSDPRATLAIDVYCYRIRRELGSLAAALSGLDAIVFTAGIGENSVAIRERVCRDAAWLGVELDAAANAAGNARISTLRSRVASWTIPTDEELVIARHTLELL